MVGPVGAEAARIGAPVWFERLGRFSKGLAARVKRPAVTFATVGSKRVVHGPARLPSMAVALRPPGFAPLVRSVLRKETGFRVLECDPHRKSIALKGRCRVPSWSKLFGPMGTRPMKFIRPTRR